MHGEQMSTNSGTTLDAETTDRIPRPLAPFARTPVLTVAALVAGLLMALTTSYGYVTDELYFLAAGKYYPAWGYMDQQPLVPLLAAFLDRMFPDSPFAFRLLPAVATALGAIITALISRELGGNRKAQALAATAY